MIGSRSIFFSQFTTNLAITIVLIVVLHGPLLYINYTERPTLEQSHKQTLAIADQLSMEFQSGKIPQLQVWRFLSKATNSILWLTDKEGLPIGGMPPEGWIANYPILDFSAENTVTAETKRIEGELYIMRVPLTLNNQSVYLFTQYNNESLYAYAWERYKQFYFLPLLLGVLAAVIIGMMLSRKLTARIVNIANTAVCFSQGDYNSRTTVTDTSELGRLGTTLNQMAGLIHHTQETRREFYANISHDLKTPLSCIQVMTEALMDGIAQNPREYKQYLQKINGETQRMSRLVNDLLDLEKLESGKSDFCLQTVDLGELLLSHRDKMKHMLEDKKMSLTLCVETDKRLIFADKDRVIQILDNLISNAIRYSPQGSCIEIKLEKINDTLFLSIADQGMGIAKDEIPLIWERFYRGDKSRKDVLGSSGLGLAITRSLVEAMKGDIVVESTIGVGSVFVLSFPMVDGQKGEK